MMNKQTMYALSCFICAGLSATIGILLVDSVKSMVLVICLIVVSMSTVIYYMFYKSEYKKNNTTKSYFDEYFYLEIMEDWSKFIIWVGKNHPEIIKEYENIEER